MLSCCLQQREKLENLEITLKSDFSKFLKVHASVLQWASEQFLEKKKSGEKQCEQCHTKWGKL